MCIRDRSTILRAARTRIPHGVRNLTLSVPDPSYVPWKQYGAVAVASFAAGFGTGMYGGWEQAKNWSGKLYGASMGAKMNRVAGPGAEQANAVIADPRVQGFSTSDVRSMLGALPNTEISPQAFMEALTGVANAKSKVAVDKRGLVVVNDPRDKLPRSKKTVSLEEAIRLFRMFDLNKDGHLSAAEIVVVFAVPVSYTHLTLPTKRIV
eukprot:TRINITY_DN18148_c0_g1_i2.p1 TRINITY_DN18148_c0_g1~~TRINITY_DN18148_c0_g1_i2.p1  ORF type:complete len:208 (-),score=49.70 TRINITY_DN18148_c0_g1_i2:78-701(-)